MSRPAARSIRFGGVEIPFTLEFRARKRLTIHVHPDRRVEVLAPAGKPEAAVLERVRRRAPWILRQLEFFTRTASNGRAKDYIAGETHYYLGRQYRLKVIRSPHDEAARLQRGYIVVATPDPADRERVAGLVEQWYLDHAKTTFERRLRAACERFRGGDRQPPPVLVRRMKTRWGSCTRAGKLVLNTDLVKTPPGCIDYVLIHELCHRKHPNHSPAFYRLLRRNLPDWAHWKDRLEAFPV